MFSIVIQFRNCSGVFELQRDPVVFDSDTVQVLGVFELQNIFSFFDKVSGTVQELRVFELQMNAACFDKDTCTVIEVRRIHTPRDSVCFARDTVIGAWRVQTPKRFSLFRQRQL